ncbi:SHOCT domain-containing protein [Mameliella sp. MMSF_3455]|uniref:SHOCT domain-containing protein n=1 Tax=Mameliella sp. MMSF_3455 TaxID=3046714 RepID=UPI00273E4A45|nr:SHOCT domain-containing protein [Mameliella sp. MMSF_3455]
MRQILIALGVAMAAAGHAVADAGDGMMKGTGMGGYGFGFGGFGMLLFWGLVIAAVALAVMRLSGRGDTGTAVPDALEELRLRYARGEIDEEEFQQRKAALDK